MNTGNAYVAIRSTQLLSLPYTLYSLNSGTSKTLGKPTIFITGNITNAQAAAQIAAEFGPQTDNVYIVNTTGLTTIDLSAITSLMTLNIHGNANLTSINLSGLTRTLENMVIDANPVLTALSFPNYATPFAYVNITYNASLASLSFPVLNKLFGTNVRIYGNTVLSSFSMPLLNAIDDTGDLYISVGKLTSLSFPALTNCSSLQIAFSNYLTSVSLPVLNTVGHLSINSNTSLTSIGIPLLATAYQIDFYNNALPSSQVNAILNKMISVSPSAGKSIALVNQTPLAPPTGQGILDKATLINAGNGVSTD